MLSVTSAFNLQLQKIDKPIRYTVEYTRGRSEKFTLQTAEDLNDLKWNYIVEFQKRAGNRRAELTRICGRNFKNDESGFACIEIERGKGGKYQFQRLNSEEDIEFVRKYFEAVGQDEKIFSPEMFRNRLNFNKLRTDSAREFYYKMTNKYTSANIRGIRNGNLSKNLFVRSGFGMKNLEAFKNADILSCNADDLVDLRNVASDKKIPLKRRADDFIARVGNPYLFKVDDTVVKVEFGDGKDFSDILIGVILTG